MSRIDEMIYHLDTMAKSFDHNIGTTQQVVDGKERFVCMMCGHSPATEAEWLREIRDELRAKTSSSVRKPKKDTTRESE